jgi:hypothetical protein
MKAQDFFYELSITKKSKLIITLFCSTQCLRHILAFLQRLRQYKVNIHLSRILLEIPVSPKHVSLLIKL